MPEAKRAADQEMLYERYVNPQWVRLLDVLRMNVDYVRCVGAELHTTNGRRILDFISGYCVHNIGHNHPRVISALKDELDRNGPAMLQSHVSELAGELAARLCDRVAEGPLHWGVNQERLGAIFEDSYAVSADGPFR